MKWWKVRLHLEKLVGCTVSQGSGESVRIKMREKQTDLTWSPFCTVYLDGQVQEEVCHVRIFAVQPGSPCVPGHLSSLDIQPSSCCEARRQDAVRRRSYQDLLAEDALCWIVRLTVVQQAARYVTHCADGRWRLNVILFFSLSFVYCVLFWFLYCQSCLRLLRFLIQIHF